MIPILTTKGLRTARRSCRMRGTRDTPFMPVKDRPRLSNRRSPLLLTKDQDALLRSELIRLAIELAPTTVRGLYYQAVFSAILDFIHKDTKDTRDSYYDLVQNRQLALRRSGDIPWDCIVDESRASYELQRFGTPADFAEVAPYYYRLDLWREQPVRPLVLVEKAGQVPVYLGHARSLGVDVAACKGYSSASHLRSVALVIDGWVKQGQRVELIVCADFDPSGCDWPRAALEEIQAHVCSPPMVTMRRELVTVADLTELGPAVALRAANPNDSRTAAFLERYGFDPEQEVCVEMDALNPNVARARVGAAIQGLFSGDLKAEQALEAEHRERIRAALEGL